MKADLLLKITIGLSTILFFTAVGALVLQPDMTYLDPLWSISLALIASMLTASALLTTFATVKGSVRAKRRLILGLDVTYIACLLLLRYSGTLYPGYRLSFEGLDGSFGYNLIYPVLLLIASLAAGKDAINLFYGYTSKGREVLAFLIIRLSALITLSILGGIFFIILYKGIWAINWEFLTGPHYNLGQRGGISTCIEGTFWLIFGAMLVSVPLGTGAAIYLMEYSRNVKLKRAISVAVGALNGVPSVVYGLFGLAFLVTTVGISLLAGSVILGLMNLPTIILTSQEALKSVPNSLREGSVALGATKWQTIRKVVLPSAMPGVLTGMIIGVARAAGETAPIMWTAVTFTATPVHMIYGVVPDPTQPVNNLCYHLLQLIYFLGAWDVETNAWGTALVLLSLVLVVNMVAVVIRNYYRKKISW